MIVTKPDPYAIQAKDLNVYYGDFRAVKDVTLSIRQKKVTAIIGPSGCGKSTVLRSFNRMNELVPTAHIQGEVLFMEQNIYAPEVDPVEVRRRIGMVFQKPNPFPQSIFDNVAFGPRVVGLTSSILELNEIVEHSLTQAAIWDDVKDHLRDSALSLSLGQQQRLCIARLLAVKPDVILMDEPASALDPIATLKIEEVYNRTYKSRDEAMQSIFEYIAVFYNRKRRHSFLDFVSPEEYESQMVSPENVA